MHASATANATQTRCTYAVRSLFLASRRWGADGSLEQVVVKAEQQPVDAQGMRHKFNQKKQKLALSANNNEEE